MPKVYSVKEIFLTIQGEGFHAGKTAVFVRFAGCNLWSGREEDRETAQCTFCDTDFVGTDGENGGKLHAEDIARKVIALWPRLDAPRFVVFTGGEPLLQLEAGLVEMLQSLGCYCAVETNGTIADNPALSVLDWVTVSPKSNNPALKHGNELKLVYPNLNCPPYFFEKMKFDHFFLQPMDGPRLKQNTEAAIYHCENNPFWRLSVQTHKSIGIK
jgi:7-carboxy-7-deazaguanine synthase